MGLTLALELHHRLVPLILVGFVLRSHGEALGPRVEHDHVLVLGIRALVDVEARLERHGPLGHGRLAAELLLALVVLEARGAALGRRAQHEITPVHRLVLAEVAALPHVLCARSLAALRLHASPALKVSAQQGERTELPQWSLSLSSVREKTVL